MVPPFPLLLSRPHTLVLSIDVLSFRCVYPKPRGLIYHSLLFRFVPSHSLHQEPSLDRPPSVVTFSTSLVSVVRRSSSIPVPWLVSLFPTPSRTTGLLSRLLISGSSWLLGLVAMVSFSKSTVTWDLSSESGRVCVEGVPPSERDLVSSEGRTIGHDPGL
ncbi:hypothetical protein BDP81DRAFT_141265 [Colletotrichum phormii]|uniref:Uncharacterized protein n=1 Tax=Colletotrichum phormii TaxID=359342 RepID=A0AAI9ZGI8_9PEZI|nr:uncharacterized protein BDP81DRAFT_141265 [Colletotrichum phormii]KAK1622944.1 hypothetical protein BDP81DRAFT_141265 [Colletotrichum phormii]